jgi:acyl-CoA reductase-like NAD-dependent aldehyde dehydrogenase
MPSDQLTVATPELAPSGALSDGVLCNHIAGQWQAPGGGELTDDTNPATPAQVLVRVVRSLEADAQAALHSAAEAQQGWGATSPLQRAAVLRRAATLLAERAETIALAMTLEEGKPLAEARAEVGRAVEVIDATAALVYRPTGEVFASRRTEQWLMTNHVPLGVAVVITPWNFPVLIPVWKVAPALLAGNSVVLKPAEVTPLTASHLVAAFHDAGLPPGVLNVLFGSGSRLGPALLQAPAAAVSFTGGNEAGTAIAVAAVRSHMKFQLELGGNNPVVVLSDADLDVAVREIVAGAVSATGQKCTATRRVYADHDALPDLLDGLRATLASKTLAPGTDPRCDVAPLVSATAREDYLAAVDRVGRIATVERFGDLPEDGFFVCPALATGGDPGAPEFREEVFGPLVSAFGIDDLEEGIRRCNATPYGLSASLFSSSVKSALRFAEAIDAGMIHINSQTTGSEPHIPFGGMKHSSSFSREIGRHGLEFFSQVKTLYLEG